MVDDYYTIKEVSEKWELSERWIRTLCAEGKIEGAVQFGRAWAIPKDTKKPNDKRIRNGDYVGWREKYSQHVTREEEKDANKYKSN